MAGSLDIYPFHDTEGAVRFGIQIAIFIVGVIVAQKLIIAPALRLHNERKKRTVGSTEHAKLEHDRAKKLEEEYLASLKKGAEEARSLRAKELQEAQDTANQIIAKNQKEALKHLDSVKAQIEAEMNQAKSGLTGQVDELVSSIYKKIGLAVLLFSLGFISLKEKVAFAASSGETSFWYSVFWPYFQFAVFLFALVYFAKKPITEMLEKRREELKVKLSEAREAAILADRKVKEYEAKIASLQSEILELKERNLSDAKFEKEKILSDAAKISEAILKDADRAAKELIARSKEEIRLELMNLALKEVDKKLTATDLANLDSKLKSEAIEGIKLLN